MTGSLDSLEELMEKGTWGEVKEELEYLYQHMTGSLAEKQRLGVTMEKLEKLWAIQEEAEVQRLNAEMMLAKQDKVPRAVRMGVGPQIQSDGGSSGYYKIVLPKEIVKQDRWGNFVIETEDVIAYVFDNDFDKGNIFKTLVRMGRKAGNKVSYETKKLVYYSQKLDKRFSNAEDT